MGMRFWSYRDRRPVEQVEEVRRAGPTEADVEAAYEKGRRDERRRHHSHPILTLVVAVIALLGGTMIYLAAREGSFARGGQVMDAQLAQASQNAQVASQDVAETAQSKLHQTTADR
jgi:hypothetical protein